MARSRYLVPLLLPWLAAAGPLPESALQTPATDAVTHANHIFNAVHNSMRQFGSSLNHNGMSLFIATVPEGTELYHGTSREYRVNGTEWLAFEPEHALIFARPHRGPPPGRRPPGGPDGHGPPEEESEDDTPKGPYFPDADSSFPEPYHGDDQEDHPRKDRPKHHGGKAGPGRGRPGKHHGDKGRPDKHHDDKGRPDKHHGPPCNGSQPDAPHHPPPPPHHGRPPPSPPHHDGPPMPHRCPAGEGHLPCPPARGPPREDFEHHGPPGEDFEHHGPPGEDFEHHGPPRGKFDHHGPPHDEFDHHGPPPPFGKHHGPPPKEFGSHGASSKNAPADHPHRFHDELSHHPHEDRDHHSGFSLPPLGFWAHRLGDLLRNPKRNASPAPSPPSAAPSSEVENIEARGANGAFGTLFPEQEPLTEDEPPKQESGYLHTYRTKHDLRLLYVDGQSAAKSKKGTLDTQDVLLLNDDIDHDGAMFGEKERANQMCKLAREEWGNRIDGILRMEGGFEIILCEFAAHLDVVSIAKTNPEAGGGFGGGADGGDGLNYYRAVAARYHGIGGGRVKLNYEDFVTAFAYPKAIYFDDTGRPRLNNASASIDDVRTAVDKMILREDSDIATVDWQAIVDLIVARYADRIEYLASGSLRTSSSLQAEIDRAIRPFIDYGSRNSTREAERCAAQFIPVHADTTTVAAQAVGEVAHKLCSSLIAASAQEDYDEALGTIRELKEYLAWTTWKQCRGCAVDEICLLPIWPIGTAEDFVQPKCKSEISHGGPGRGKGYWNDFGGPPPGPRSEKRRKRKE